jgi:hypothetical protein
MGDRSSRPHHCPHRTPQPLVRAIVHLRWKQRLGPVEIADRTGLAPSTVHAVLVRCRISRLPAIDRASGEPVRRYEHPYPGSLVHVDVKKLGNVPDGGGWRYAGRAQGLQNRLATGRRTGQRSRGHGHPLTGTAFIHTVATTIPAWPTPRSTSMRPGRPPFRYCATRPPGSLPAACGSSVCCPGSGACYRSKLWAAACAELGITHKRTRPYRPQTNGNIERFHRPQPRDGPSGSSTPASQPAALPSPPGSTTAITTGPTPRSDAQPLTRLTNVPGQYS